MSDLASHGDAAEELVDAIKRFQDAVDFFDATAARALGVNATDLRCLTALRDRGPMKASDVATQLGLTRGATTTALDRLQERRLLSRRADVRDGRGVIIALTRTGQERVDAIWAPMRVQGREHLRTYSLRDLTLLRRFFERSIALQARCSDLLPTPKRTSRTPSRRRATPT